MIRSITEPMKDPEFRGIVIKDLLLGFLFGALGTVGSIIRSVQARKAAKAGAKN